jgi:hypothetical protein
MFTNTFRKIVEETDTAVCTVNDSGRFFDRDGQVLSAEEIGRASTTVGSILSAAFKCSNQRGSDIQANDSLKLF